MARHRSPNYPALGLSEAVDLARQIYVKEKKTQAPGEIIAKALGYSSLSGNARVKISTLKKYGLLEGDENKGMRLSDLAMLILYPSNLADEAEAKRTAALYPSLFKSLFEDRIDGSDEAMVNYLVSKQDFSPLGAKQAVEAFRDTVSFSGLPQRGYNASSTPDKSEAQAMEADTRSASAGEAFKQSSDFFHTLGTKAPLEVATNTWTWTLSMPRSVKAALIITGPVTKADVGRLKKQVASLEESFDEDETQESTQ